MILLPTSGIAERNIDRDVFADWIEACVLFKNTDVSVQDVVDVLLREQLCKDQDAAREAVHSAWSEIEQRRHYTGAFYGVAIEGNWVKESSDKTNHTAHKFLLTLSLATRYDWWRTTFGADYTEQGRHFESLTAMALAALTPGWSVFPTGWKAGSANSHFRDVAQAVAKCLNITHVIEQEWDIRKAKDLTLDILVHWPFMDSRRGAPYIMLQCASGANWADKLKEPDTDLWRKLLNPDCVPIRGVCIPFCLRKECFHRAGASAAGLLLDRCRILSAATRRGDWLKHELAVDLDAWMKPRIAEVLKRSE